MSDLDPLLELLKAWLAQNSRSPLDDTVSCIWCRALVLAENADGHITWHRALAGVAS